MSTSTVSSSTLVDDKVIEGSIEGEPEKKKRKCTQTQLDALAKGRETVKQRNKQKADLSAEFVKLKEQIQTMNNENLELKMQIAERELAETKEKNRLLKDTAIVKPAATIEAPPSPIQRQPLVSTQKKPESKFVYC